MRSFSRGGSGYRPFTHRSGPANQPLLNVASTPATETPSYTEDPFASTTSVGYPFPPSASKATTCYTPSSVTATTATTTTTTIVAGSAISVNGSSMSGGKRAGLRKLATTIVHPRRSRSQRKTMKVEMRRKEEEDRIREIEEFLESGRGGPIR